MTARNTRCLHCGRTPGEGGCDWIECPGHSPANPEGFDTASAEFACERGVGLTIYAHQAAPWLSWDETKALSAWLAELVQRDRG